MKTKIQIKTVFGKVLFEFEKENNSVKDTLVEAVEQDANLQGAYLRGAYLQDANLRDAYLQGAYLRGAYLQDAKNINLNKYKHLIWIIPEVGSFIAWKKLENNCIAKLEIPVKSPRTCNFLNRKCRAKYVKTLMIWDSNGNEIKEARNGTHDKKILYKVGRLTRADRWCDDLTKDCSHGIHFFITKQEAKDW